MDKITVLCPNGHRVTITTSRNTTLSEILDEVCKKKSFDARGHVLQHHSKNVDLALSVHLANLPRNSHLEMVAAEAPAPGILSLRWFSIYKDRWKRSAQRDGINIKISMAVLLSVKPISEYIRLLELGVTSVDDQ